MSKNVETLHLLEINQGQLIVWHVLGSLASPRCKLLEVENDVENVLCLKMLCLHLVKCCENASFTDMSFSNLKHSQTLTGSGSGTLVLRKTFLAFLIKHWKKMEAAPRCHVAIRRHRLSHTSIIFNLAAAAQITFSAAWTSWTMGPNGSNSMEKKHQKPIWKKAFLRKTKLWFAEKPIPTSVVVLTCLSIGSCFSLWSVGSAAAA